MPDDTPGRPPGHTPDGALASFRLDGRVCVVTGASSGLGERFARVLAAAGATVVCAARRADRLRTLVDDLPAAVAVAADVTDSDGRARIMAAATDAGGVDVLVNNAGLSSPVRAEDESDVQWDDVVAVNLTAVHHLAVAAARTMFDRGGSIVNVASMYGLVGRGDVPIGASYAATKGGVVNLTRELAGQWGRRGVRVNALCPGYFRSEMTEDGFDDPRFAERLRRRAPLQRPGDVHELDGALLFLCSDASSYVTGSVLAVDGGWTAI
jgi:NAD(P)-dependent dehydrogenase (short-subunit alcohol dehydrogenase family)